MESLLAEQDARKTSIEQRGLAVITTSGTLATLMFGLVAVLTKSDSFKLPAAAHAPVRLAIGFFGAAALMALFANMPMLYASVAAEPLRDMAWKHWDDPPSDALMRVTATRFKILIRARYINGLKAMLLTGAAGFEILAVGAVGYAVWQIV